MPASGDTVEASASLAPKPFSSEKSIDVDVELGRARAGYSGDTDNSKTDAVHVEDVNASAQGSSTSPTGATVIEANHVTVSKATVIEANHVLAEYNSVMGYLKDPTNLLFFVFGQGGIHPESLRLIAYFALWGMLVICAVVTRLFVDPALAENDKLTQVS